MKTKIYPASEVANILRKTLGPLRAWDDSLADMRRHKTNVNGFVLLPACQIHDGRAWRPGYTAASIVAFIKAVSAANADAKSGVAPQFKLIELDPADMRTWSARKLRAMAAGYIVGRIAGGRTVYGLA